eukprot:scaffold292645_cov38-Tisochrysis_lutea.AAC.3
MTLGLIVGLASLASAVPQPLTQIEEVAYGGRWFQMYASFGVKYTFELGGNCVTADYGATAVPAEEGLRGATFSVLNTVRLFPAFARYLPNIFTGIRINGFAVQSPASDGSLQVSLGPFANDPAAASYSAPGNYWIVALGPVVDGKYDWAVVSDSQQSSLYILTRDVVRFRSDYENSVLAQVESMGFTGFFNKPLATNQDGCYYDGE